MFDRFQNTDPDLGSRTCKQRNIAKFSCAAAIFIKGLSNVAVFAYILVINTSENSQNVLVKIVEPGSEIEIYIS